MHLVRGTCISRLPPHFAFAGVVSLIRYEEEELQPRVAATLSRPSLRLRRNERYPALSSGTRHIRPAINKLRCLCGLSHHGMSANYWESTQRRHWLFSKDELASMRQKLDDDNIEIVRMFPLPQPRHLAMFFNQRKLLLVSSPQVSPFLLCSQRGADLFYLYRFKNFCDLRIGSASDNKPSPPPRFT